MKNDTYARKAYQHLLDAENAMRNAGCMKTETAYDAVLTAIKTLGDNIASGAFLPPLPQPEQAKRVTRARLQSELEAAGYRVSGNHVFSISAYLEITLGRQADSVTESPGRFPGWVVKKAEQLAATF